jgi:hypothetical protein
MKLVCGLGFVLFNLLDDIGDVEEGVAVETEVDEG